MGDYTIDVANCIVMKFDSLTFFEVRDVMEELYKQISKSVLCQSTVTTLQSEVFNPKTHTLSVRMPLNRGSLTGLARLVFYYFNMTKGPIDIYKNSSVFVLTATNLDTWLQTFYQRSLTSDPPVKNVYDSINSMADLELGGSDDMVLFIPSAKKERYDD